MNNDDVNLSNISANLFDSTAKSKAQILKNSMGSENKPTQLRRFYDEIVMWDNKLKTYPEKFNESLPMIRMLNAKVAYARGRKLVDDNYVSLMAHCLQQVNSVETFRNFKLFMEAVMGFYKSMENNR